MGKDLFRYNAYNILGLDSDASEREIVKRSREIENLLKIDETPEYEVDLPFSKELRTEANVKNALSQLTTPEKKISEVFFWLFVVNDTDEKVLKLFKDGKYTDALDMLKKKLSASSNNFSAMHNKAVFESLIFGEKAQKKYLAASLKSWQKIFNSDKHWSEFKKVYKLNNPDANEALFEKFKEQAEKILSGFYEGMSRSEKNPEIYAAFGEKFSAHSDTFDRDTLDPLLNKLNACTEAINKYKIEYQEVYDSNLGRNKKRLAKASIAKMDQFMLEATNITDELEALGDKIWNSAKVNVVRDKNALALRGLVIEITNNVDVVEFKSDIDFAEEILDIAYDICAVDSVAEKRIEKDKRDFEGFETLRKFKKLTDGVERDIKAQRFHDAVMKINEILALDDVPSNVKNEFRELRSRCISARSRPQTYNRPVSNYGGAVSHNSSSSDSGGSFWGWLIFIIIVIILIIAFNS